MTAAKAHLVLMSYIWMSSEGSKRAGVIVRGPTLPPGFARSEGKILPHCPLDHPYAYGKGYLCSNALIRTNNSALNPLCDGTVSTIYTPAECCPEGSFHKCSRYNTTQCKSRYEAVGAWRHWTPYCNASNGFSSSGNASLECVDRVTNQPVECYAAYSVSNASCCATSKVVILGGNETACTASSCCQSYGYSPTCSVPEWPLNLVGAVGAYFSNTLVMCTGLYFSYLFGGPAPYGSNCSQYSFGAGEWSSFPDYPDGRTYAASVMTDRGWWVVGGYSNPMSPETFFFDEPTWSWLPGPNLTVPRQGHCAARINGSAYFIAGGRYDWGDPDVNDTWVYDLDSAVWTQWPDMPRVVYAAACSAVVDAASGLASRLIVTGGSRSMTLALSLDLASLEWTILPDLPSNTHFATFVNDGPNLVLVNTFSQNVMLFVEANSTFAIMPGWTTGNVTYPQATVVAVSGGCE